MIDLKVDIIKNYGKYRKLNYKIIEINKLTNKMCKIQVILTIENFFIKFFHSFHYSIQ